MAGSSTFPTSVDNKTALVDGVDYVEADNINNAYVPINKTQTFIGANGKGASWSTDILEYLANKKAPICTKTDADTISVSAGVVFIKNSGQTNRLMRRNTVATTVEASSLDTGTMAVGYYYIYAVADSAATTFTVKFSASASAPTGLTNFELIGWFYNQTAGVLDITLPYIGNVKANGRDVPNVVVASGTTADTINDTSYGTDLTEVTVRFYSTGRPVEVSFDFSGTSSAHNVLSFILDVDGTDETASEVRGLGFSSTTNNHANHLKYVFTPAAGTHTYTIQAKVGADTVTAVRKHLSVKEL